MYSEDIFRHQKLATAETNYTSIVVSGVESERVKAEKIENKPIVANLSLGIVLLSCVICFIMLSKSWMAAQEDLEEMIEIASFSQSPCRKCRFFFNNPFLKCAVHPTIVLTKEANNCADYNPRTQFLK
ncbi:hypothetical protein H6G17_13065 [Chroococcidiopsis sp. FACHB-1243]|uniref:hypothetical protein n=1 Tax=Chroococcidiopsis sp. [FACHB-1243] TaxID=2692781 RepID=UPI0017837943|nr:hypothetical protein [Chroococcidiopsis sp. [FACHB-1243]]MBD2306441.1 hypothetical protein [Chroococcidiopsis sp. [FACHB-1243]]